MDSEKLQKLAKLSRIEIRPEDEKHLLDLLNADINTVKAVYTIDTEGLEPLINPYDMQLRTQEDGVSDGDRRDDLLHCAAKSSYGYYIVPKILEN